MESDAVEADDDLQNIPAAVMEDIIHKLNQNDAWLNLAKNLRDGRGRRALSDDSLSQMKSASSPAREVIDFLKTNLWRVYNLQAILERCHLFNILKLINTNDPVKIVAPEEDTSYRIILGSRVSLPAEVCGSPYPDIQWYFNNKPLIRKTSPELMLENFCLKDVGEYYYKVKQRLNGTLSELTSPKYILNASNSPPKILKDLEDMEIPAYEDMTLSFKVTGYPKPQCFSWFKNNRFISKTENPQFTKGAADIHSSGEYHCEVSNEAGTCTTRRALVKVLEPIMCPEKPEIIEQPSQNQVYYVGDQMNLSCEVHCSTPVVFTCFLNNEMLTESSDIHKITTSRSKYHHKCDLKYHLTKEQMDKENWKPLLFKFEVSSLNSRTLSDDVKVEVKTRDVKRSFSARNKWALLIGNSDYQQMGELPAAKNDIKTLQKSFVDLGFRVLMLTNLNRTETKNGVELFSKFIQKGDYVSFFYAGHGIHNNGKDYIIPLDASVKYVSKVQNICTEKESDISLDECLSYVWITNILQKGEPALIFSIYDTCRRMKPNYDGCHSHSSHDTYQTALKNSFFIFATSENYEAYESVEKDSSLLVNTIQALMTQKISVNQLANKVLENFYFPNDYDLGRQEPQVPKITGDLALPLSLVDPSRPHEDDKSESGVLMKWERLGGLGGVVQDSIPLANTKVKASVFWNNKSRKDGVTWVISNCLLLIVNLSQEWHPDMEEMDVRVNLSAGKKNSGKLKTELQVEFWFPHLQDFEECLRIELHFTCRGQSYKKELYLESPAISEKFFKGNCI